MDFIFLIPSMVIIVISVFVVKIAAVALNLTGMDEKKAFFQAMSAFTGTGFTTRESELVMNDEIRRRIIIILMVLGNAGFITVITTLMLSFRKAGIAPVLGNIAIILAVIVVLIAVFSHKGITRRLTKRIQARLVKSSTFTKRPVEEILRLAEGYGVAEVTLNENCVDIGKALSESSFRQKDILIMAIERGTGVIPAPHASDRLMLNDALICYGKLENIDRIGKGKQKETTSE
ncbi:MAG: TrkA C-terminal domain-containing protein [Candidatus Omnitrophica bacterium]|nr:TrkA C-terminal domain-containing protein [Candidatus Omnitrophota bacterium]